MSTGPTGRLRLVSDCTPLASEIARLVEAAFRQEYGTGADEARLIAGLRTDGDVAVELAALQGDEVVGFVMFSRLKAAPADRRVAALAPVAAKIGLQKKGIGSALIEEGHRRLRALGYHAVAVLGDPAYYRRFGYTLELGRKFECPYAGDHFQAVELVPQTLDGGPWQLTYSRAFG